MIGKKLKASKGSARNRLRYIYGSKKHDHDIVKIRTVYTNCAGFNPEVGISNGSEADLEAMIRDMDVPTKLKLGAEGKRKGDLRPIAHWIISLADGEKLTDEQWNFAVKFWLKEMGFKPTNKATAAVHEDTDNEHAHLAINRICNEPGFEVISDKDDFQKNMEAIWKLEKHFGLKMAARPENTWNPTVNARTVLGAQNAGTMPYETRLAAKIGGCVKNTKKRDGDMLMFVRSLRRQGVYVHLRYELNGAPKGITYEFEDRFMSGSELKKARCTWQKLTGQEGIRYDQSMLPQLKIELSKRNRKGDEQPVFGKNGARYYSNRGWIYMYFVPENTSRAPFIKLKVKNTGKSGDQVRAEIAYRQAMELVEMIMKLLELIFGGVRYTAKPGNAKGDGYTEWNPGEDFPIFHPDEPQRQKALELA
jgi:hypothetical protein